MARLEFFVVSRSVSIDGSTNQASVFEILDEVYTTKFPISLSCVVLTVWCREDGDEEKDFQARLRITNPSGNINNILTNFRITSARHRLIQRVEGIPLTEAGNLRFEMTLNDDHIADHIVDIHHSGPLNTIGSPATSS